MCLYKSLKGFIIVAVYVDTLIGTPEEFEKTTDYLKNESYMKYHGKMKICLDLQIERNFSAILVCQFNYT